MVSLALYVRLEAKPGKEAEVEAFLKGGLPIAQDEPDTIAWFAILARAPSWTFGMSTSMADSRA